METPKKISLSVCVIGRNEGKNLSRISQSLAPLKGLGISVETLFIDSASTDNSIEVARDCFDRVYSLEESPNLCASAGRYVGTERAQGEWILYLDGDMVLQEAFLEVIQHAISEQPEKTGYLGMVRHRYNNGDVRNNAHRYKKQGMTVPHFGGAVLLPRNAVLKAGNWNPCVFAQEEIELYTRMRAQGIGVCFMNIPMVEHFTEKISNVQILLSNLTPKSIFGKKHYGLGQVIASRVRSRQLWSLLRYFPYPFVFWFCNFLALTLLVSGWAIPAVLTALIGVAFVSYTKGARYVALYLTQVSQVIRGWNRYNPEFRPLVKSVWERQALCKPERGA